MISKLQPYAAYKNSDEEWLGAIPQHWETRRAKFLFHEVDERSTTGKEELLSVSHLTGVTPRSQKTITMFLAKSNIGHKVCRPGDLAINTMWAWMGALGVSNHVGLVSPAYGVYRPHASSVLVPAFADLLLRTPLYSAEYQRRSTGVNSSRLRLYPDKFLRIPVVVPPMREQEAIIGFLGWANRRVDRAILSKRKVIALLNEQKRAIVRRFVTRGTTPSANLKPSGADWLGDIPKHWDARKLRSLFSFQGSGTTPSGDTYYDGPINWVMSGDLNDSTVTTTKRTVTNEALTAYSTLKLYPPNSLVVAMYGATIGKTGILGIAACTNQACCVLALPKAGVRVSFVQFVLQIAKEHLLSEAYGGGQPNINAKVVGSLKIPLPPLEEQDSIMNQIESSTSRLKATIASLQSEITLIREFRTRLIIDIATGKLDVQHAVIALPDELMQTDRGLGATISLEEEFEEFAEESLADQ